jgi:hypothetical protein
MKGERDLHHRAGDSRLAPQGTPAEEAFRAAARAARGLAMKMGWPPDRSAIDFRAGLAMRKKGFSVDDVMAAMLAESVSLGHRQRDAVDYVARTCRRIEAELSKPRKKA